MSVIASKYLAQNVNRLAAGNDTLLKANNLVNDDGQLRPRNGQDLISRVDKPLIGAYPSTCDTFKPIKIWFYNNQLWVYFRNGTDQDAVGYYDFAGNIWKASSLVAANYTPGSLPQIVEADRRLVLLTKDGAAVAPKLQTDKAIGSLQASLQTTFSPAGALKALPIDLVTFSNTTGTYAQNWMASGAKVAYTTVWKKTNENGLDILGATGGRTVVLNNTGAATAITLRIQFPYELVNAYTYSPAEASKYTLQVFRTYTSLVDGTGAAPDPGANFYLVMEIRPTAAELAAGTLNFLDIQSDFTLQDPLYTNEFELGPTQEKDRPPFSNCLATFQSCVWYGNTIGPWRNFFSLQAVMDGGGGLTRYGLRPNDVIIAGDWAFEAISGVPANWQFALDTTTGVASQITRALNTTDSLIRQYNRNPYSTRFHMHSVRGPDDFAGTAYLEEQRPGVVNNVSADYAPYIGLCRANGYATQPPCPISPVPKISDAVGVGYNITQIRSFGGTRTKFQIVTTAYGGGAPDFAVGDKVNVAKINGDQSCWFQFNGLSGALGTVAAITVAGVNTYDIEFDGILAPAATYTAGGGPYVGYALLGAMHAVYDLSTGGVSNAIGTRDETPHRAYYSPPHEPEVTPPLQYFDFGASDKKIVAIKALSDSLFVFKEDGLYRVQGYYPDFYVSLFDENVVISGPELIAQMAGSLYVLTTKGVYEITEQGASRISFPIQSEIDYIVANNQQNVYSYGFMTCNPADQRLYLWLPDIGQTKPNKCFVYDGQGWTARTDQANYACSGMRSGTSDQMSLYTAKDIAGMWITKERRSMTMFDFCDEDIRPTAATILNESAINLAFVADASRPALTSSFASNFVGAVIIWNGNHNSRAVVTEAKWSGSNTFDMTLEWKDTTTAWDTSDWDAVASKYQIFLPFTKELQYGISADGEDPSFRQHWTDVSLFTSQPLFTDMDLGFSTDVNPTQSYLPAELDGFLSGLYSFQNLTLWRIKRDDPKIAEKTLKRTIPSTHQRGSQLRVSLRHKLAMEFFSILGYSVRTQRGGPNIERNNNV